MAKSSSPAKTPKLAQSKRVASTKPKPKSKANAGARRKPAAEKVNVGKLISEIRGIEADEERGRKYRALITKVVMQGSIEEGYFHAALRWENSARTARNRVHGQPGTARVLAICRDEFGDASGASLMRLRDRLSIRLGCEPAEVATMSLENFLAAWNGDPGKPKTGGKAGGKVDGEQQATSAAEPWLLPIDAPNPDGFYAAETIVTSRTCAGALVLHPNKRVKKDPKLFRDELARPKLKTKVLCRDTTSKFDVELIFKTKELYDAHISQLAQVSEFVKTLPKYRG